MQIFKKRSTSRSIRNGSVCAALALCMMAGVAEATPIAPGSMLNQTLAPPIEKVVVVVHRRVPRRQVCWWSHGRRICRWR